MASDGGERNQLMATSVKVGISLELSCSYEMCTQFARPLFEQMSSGRYDRCSVMRIPWHIDDWREEHRTARKRADRCARRGYRFDEIARHQHADEIHAINTSVPERQGRPMASGYLERTEFGVLPSYQCHRHAVRTYGVNAPDGTLVAYLWLYRAGDLGLVSQILGHADHLRDEIMYLLWQGMLTIESEIDQDGVIVYNRHDSGTDGLRFYKERVGLTEQQVEWLP